MKTNIIDSRGAEILTYHSFIKNDPADDEIEIKTEFCGICRSDIAVYAGWESPLPFGHFGHEGAGTVTKVGKCISSVQEGDFVATISDPAYGTFYNAKESEFVKIPELSSKYIIQPVACAINILNETLFHARGREDAICMFGTGFMSLIIGQYCKKNNIELIVVGSANQEMWSEIGYDLKTRDDVKKEKFSVIMDLSSKAATFDLMCDIIEIEGLMVMASTPFTPVTTNFFKNSWNCSNFIFPSPRNTRFRDMMSTTVGLMEDNIIQPENLWTRGYKIDNAKQGFDDGTHRDKSYIRGFIDFG